MMGSLSVPEFQKAIVVAEVGKPLTTVADRRVPRPNQG